MRETDQNRGGEEQGLRELQGPHQLWLLQASRFFRLDFQGIFSFCFFYL